MLGHPHPPRAAAPTRLALLPSALPSALLALVLVLVLGSAPALADPADEPEAPATAYQAAGAEIEGGSSIAQAPTVAPGLHRDSFAEGGADVSGDGTAKYYRIAVGEGERVHAAAVIAAPPYGSGVPEDYQDLSVGLAFVTAGGDDCNDSSTGTYGETHTADGPITTVRVSGPMGPEDCAGTELFLKVTRMGTRLADQPLPIEVQIAIEPAGTAGGDPSVDEEIADSGASPVAPAQSEPIELGRSFSGALPVEPGSYVIELVPGEVGFVSVPVGEGQRLRWRTEIVSEVGEEAGQLVVLARNPVRDQVAVGGGNQSLSQRGIIEGGGMTAPVAVGNRSSEKASIRSAWLPGTHTVMVQRLQRPEGAAAAGADPVRLILTLEVEGEAAEGASEVLELGDLPSGSSGGLSDLGFLGELGMGKLVMLGTAGLLAVVAVLTGVAGAAVLWGRRRR